MSRQRTDDDSFRSVMGNWLSTNIFRIYVTKSSRIRLIKSEYTLKADVRLIHSETSTPVRTVCFDHPKCSVKQQYFLCKYPQLHSLVLPVVPLCLGDHRSPWCSELEIPSPILFLWHLWRTDTGASSPAERERWDHSCMIDLTQATQTELVSYSSTYSYVYNKSKHIVLLNTAKCGSKWDSTVRWQRFDLRQPCVFHTKTAHSFGVKPVWSKEQKCMC